MAKIEVKVRSDAGDLGVHRKYGALVPGRTITIDEEDFGDELFERPAPEWLSPHEQADRDRAAAENTRVGKFDPPVEKTKKGDK